MSRWDSAAIVPKTSELFPEPETPVKTVSRRFGSSTLTSLRLLTRAPCTRIRSWLSACAIVGGRLRASARGPCPDGQRPLGQLEANALAQLGQALRVEPAD